ncbi:MAG: DNA repair protein RadC [Pseudomonadota bacterium]|nr:DNA repair protein RadC [Pseudomonadota bacterium]
MRDVSTLTKQEQCRVLEQAAVILNLRLSKDTVFGSPNEVKQFLACKLRMNEREVFAVLLLDSQNRLIEMDELFYGTINAASVYPREIVKTVLANNAAGVILAHNHPSGISEPSFADKQITKRITDALGLIDVPVLDHFIVGDSIYSMAEHGCLDA